MSFISEIVKHKKQFVLQTVPGGEKGNTLQELKRDDSGCEACKKNMIYICELCAEKKYWEDECFEAKRQLRVMVQMQERGTSFIT